MNDEVYTTGKIARMCKVAPRTVSKWFDTGRLKGYRIPMSRDRRVPHESLIAFLKEFNLPLPSELGGQSNVSQAIDFQARPLQSSIDNLSRYARGEQYEPECLQHDCLVVATSHETLAIGISRHA